MRVRRRDEEAAQRLNAAEVEEEEALEVERAHAERERVRERVQREREEVRGDGRGERGELVRACERVHCDRLDGRAREEEAEERRGGRDVRLRGEAVRGHGVDCGDEGVDGGAVVRAGDVVDGVEEDV